MFDRMDLSQTERIGRLIYRRILGVITAEEDQELHIWRWLPSFVMAGK